PKIDGGHPWRRSFKDNIIYTDWEKDNFIYAVKKVLQEANMNKSYNLGIENDHITLAMNKKLNDALNEANMIDVSTEIMKLRIIKSSEEIEIIRNGSYITEVGRYATLKAIDEGMPEYEISLQGTKAMIREA